MAISMSGDSLDLDVLCTDICLIVLADSLPRGVFQSQPLMRAFLEVILGLGILILLMMVSEHCL